MKKRLLATVLVFSLLLALAACGSDSSDETSAPADDTEPVIQSTSSPIESTALPEESTAAPVSPVSLYYTAAEIVDSGDHPFAVAYIGTGITLFNLKKQNALDGYFPAMTDIDKAKIRTYMTDGEEIYLVIPKYSDCPVSAYTYLASNASAQKEICQTALPFFLICNAAGAVPSDVRLSAERNGVKTEFFPVRNALTGLLEVASNEITDATRLASSKAEAQLNLEIASVLTSAVIALGENIKYDWEITLDPADAEYFWRYMEYAAQDYYKLFPRHVPTAVTEETTSAPLSEATTAPAVPTQEVMVISEADVLQYARALFPELVALPAVPTTALAANGGTISFDAVAKTYSFAKPAVTGIECAFAFQGNAEGSLSALVMLRNAQGMLGSWSVLYNDAEFFGGSLFGFTIASMSYAPTEIPNDIEWIAK